MDARRAHKALDAVIDRVRARDYKPLPSGNAQTQVYKGYSIVPIYSGGFGIVKDGHTIQHYVGSVTEAKKIIDQLA